MRLMALLWRNPALSREEFRDHWLHRHGPMIRDTPELARHIRRYEQHLPTDVPDFFGCEDCDGVTIQCFDSMDDFHAFLGEPAYGELVAPDEEYLLDRSRLRWVLVDDPVVTIGAPDG